MIHSKKTLYSEYKFKIKWKYKIRKYLEYDLNKIISLIFFSVIVIEYNFSLLGKNWKMKQSWSFSLVVTLMLHI